MDLFFYFVGGVEPDMNSCAYRTRGRSNGSGTDKGKVG